MTSDNQRTSAMVRAEAADGRLGSEDVVVTVAGVNKTFGTVRALVDVDFTLRRGTVHALVGENGSGKSTLTKVIAGAHQPDSGTVHLEGELIDEVTPRIALNHGVRVIFQDLALFPNMSVAENIGFDGGGSVLGRVPVSEHRARAREALDTLGLNISPDAILSDLSTAERQLVAIARAVSSKGRIILMDEPTAALTHKEIDLFLDTVRRLADQGMSFVFISHKLREVAAIADDLTVIRDGKIISTGPASDYDQERISYLMTGGLVTNQRRETAWEASDAPVLSVRNLGLSTTYSDVSFDLHAGRVLGLSGVVGCGKIEIGQAVAGLIGHDRGEILFEGKRVRKLRGRRDIQYVPDDRLTEGLFLEWAIADNIVTQSVDQATGKGGLVSVARIRELAQTWREKLRIKTPSVDAPAYSLSGGNQQRVLLARALAPNPKVIILNNPTVGVDVGSRAEIHDLVRSMSDESTAVLLISDEPAELMSVCDDVAFVADGRITEVHPVESLSEDSIIEINGKEVA